MEPFLLECEELTREFSITGKSVRVVDSASLGFRKESWS
jgi:hypothetical protein